MGLSATSPYQMVGFTGQCECIEGYGRLEGASDCHELLKQGPCTDGQRLVLDQEGQVVCQDTTCLEDEYYFNGECVQMARTFDICKNGTQMAENFQGKGKSIYDFSKKIFLEFL